MKRITKISTYICAFAILTLGLLGCENSNPVINRVSKVKQLYTPKNNYSVVLKPNGSLTFSWAPAKAVDGGYVSYEVAFDTVGGDFSPPAFQVPSAGNGLKTSVTLSAKTLNEAAAQVGIKNSQTGNLIWTVISSRGVNQKIALESRKIQITRLAGFANPPSTLYITGSGTEAGADLANAIPLKPTGNGQFKIFTKLTTNGTYEFVSSTSGSPREFYIIKGSDGSKIVKGSSGSTIKQNGVYRIKLDFTTGVAAISRVANLQLYSAAHSDEIFSLKYQGRGVFLAKNQKEFFAQESWGLDSRYRYLMTLVKPDGNTIQLWLANKKGNVNQPNSSTPPSYWYLVPTSFSSLGQWDHTYKLGNKFKTGNIDVYVYLQSGKPYTQKITKASD